MSVAFSYLFYGFLLLWTHQKSIEMRNSMGFPKDENKAKWLHYFIAALAMNHAVVEGVFSRLFRLSIDLR